ncbi:MULTISPECIES: hypothetical protein [Vibrio]|uniref:Adhesin n=1 Tax=Vibrio campbellii TaxID=680 RepID=A0AAQ2XW27_9VIBR|nr:MULTISPECIES: hypothetical protein [Vibrio]WDG07103.1 hypothetical protein PUN50_10110 [Vibrio campbellii]
MKNKIGLALFTMMTSALSIAASEGPRFGEISLMPSVRIVKDQGASGIEITPEQKLYTTKYDVGAQSFLPLRMGFDVTSTRNQLINYNLTITPQNYCRGEGETNDREINGVEYTFDGQPVMPSETSLEINSGPHATSNINRHELTLNFPTIGQNQDFQQCYGFVGILAEVVGSY